MSGSLSLDYAQQLIARGIAAARQQGVAVCICVYDDGANMITFIRMDNTRWEPLIWPKGKRKRQRYFAYLVPIWGSFQVLVRNYGLSNTVIRAWPLLLVDYQSIHPQMNSLAQLAFQALNLMRMLISQKPA